MTQQQERPRTDRQIVAGLKCYQQMGKLNEEFICRMELCPYWSEDDDTGTSLCNVPQIIADAIGLLEADTPRLLTLDEVHALDEGDSVWMETRYIIKPDGEVSINLELGVVIPGTKEIHFDGWWDRLDRMTDYSDTQDMKARYWSAEPTDEQREATPWE